MKKSVIYLFLILISIFISGVQAKTPDVSLIADYKNIGEPGNYALKKLSETFKTKEITYEIVPSSEGSHSDILFIIGLPYDNNEISAVLKESGHSVPAKSQAMTIFKTRWNNKDAVVITGHDSKGLMYALLDVARRVNWSDKNEPLRHIKDITSEPYVEERGISMYTMHRRYWEERFHNENFWIGYFDMMALNRLNMLEILFGYENGGFMAPCYPYFFNVEGFPEVKMEDITPEQQQQNIDAMHRLIALAHERGIGVRLGVWDHLYRGGVQAGGNPLFEYDPNNPLPWQVTGLEPTGNLIPYTKAAFAKLLNTFPELDAILFKTNNESGLKTEELHDFSVSFFETVAETAPEMRIDIHSKGLTDALIDKAIQLGIKFRIAPKYWMEQLGLPFSPTHINREDQKNRRHGYADMLRYPQQYQILWKLWNGGTNRAFLWGSPEYVRRFAQSSHLYNSDAYEIYEPMATKMEAQRHDIKPFELLNAPYRYYDNEYERYWYFFQLWGLLGYDPNTPTDVWEKEFEIRFGEKAAPIIQSALDKASWILPRIIASCYPYRFFPTTSAWPEKQRLGDLPVYAKAEGSDLQQFASFDEEAQILLGNLETGKTRPSTTSLWLKELSEDLDKKIAESTKVINKPDNKEFKSTITDIQMLSKLALYHSRRIPAAVSYCLFLRTQDPAALDEAIAHEQNAINAWEELVNAAGDIYTDNILIGNASISGHWRDELKALKRDLSDLKKQRSEFRSGEITAKAPVYQAASASDNNRYFEISHLPVDTIDPGQSVTIEINIDAPAGVKWVNLHYRPMNQYLDFAVIPMTPISKNRFKATIPESEINKTYDLMYLIEMMDNNGHGLIYPDFNKTTPYHIIHLRQNARL